MSIKAQPRSARPLQPVVDPADWGKQDLADSMDWQYRLSAGDIAELDEALAGAKRRSGGIVQISRKDFSIPTLSKTFDRIREELLDGRGLFLLRGIPVERYSRRDIAMLYWGIGQYIGDPVAQNVNGDALGHVKDMFGDQEANDQQRDNHTAKRLLFHFDACDVVGLLCLHPAKSGGISSVVSSVRLHNEMLKRRPDLAAELAKPFYHTRRGELTSTRKPWFQVPLFTYFDDHFSMNLSIGNYEARYEALRGKFPELPAYTEKQREAILYMEALANELCFDMELQQGDIQFLHSHVTLHARTRFEDYEEPERKRHLLRLWLATPGGRPLPLEYNERYYELRAGQRPVGVSPGMELVVNLEPAYAETRDYESFKQKAS